MSLNLTYRFGLNTYENVGINPFNSKENSENLIIQSNNNVLENAKSFKFSYMLGSNSTKEIKLSDLCIKFVKLICLEATNTVSYTYSTHVIEGSLIVIDNKIPTILPIEVSEETITINNISSEIVNLTVAIVGMI